jgi:superfamily II DNA helicase RecQ
MYVAATGEGKSLPFVLIAYASQLSGTTAVIVPLVSLQHDFMHCCGSKINARIWTHMSHSDDHWCIPLIFVTPESALRPLFKNLVQSLISIHQPDRFVVDECHMYLNSTSNFRCKMKNVDDWLSSTGIPRKFLTAALPPSEEKNLFQLLNIDE